MRNSRSQKHDDTAALDDIQKYLCAVDSVGLKNSKQQFENIKI